MAIKNQKELFVLMLSELRNTTERTTKFLQELAQPVQDAEIQEAIEARVFISKKILDTLEQCFSLIGEEPSKASGRVTEVFAEEFRKDLAEIQSSTVRHLFVLARASQVVHLQVAEYKSLVAAADISGHYGVGVLLESCLADNLVFIERTQRLVQNIAATKMADKIAVKSVA